MEQKKCPKCGHTKDVSAFGKRSRNPDGRHEMCKTCVNAVARRWRAADPERARQVTRRYRSRHPERARGQSQRWKAEHPERVTEYAKLYRETHREEIAAYRQSAARHESTKRWRQKHRERFLQACWLWRKRNRLMLAAWYRQRRRKAGPRLYSPQEWEALLNQTGRRCLCCGVHEQHTPEKFLVADHVVPVCMDGPFTIDNIQPLCFGCNRIKNGRVIDFRRVRSVLE